MISEPKDGVIEVELTLEDLGHAMERQASISNAVTEQGLPPTSDMQEPKAAASARRQVMRLAGVFAITFALIGLGRVIHREHGPSAVLSHNANNVTVKPQLLPPEQARQPSSPVRVANPFDASEVFEFPPGTLEASARESVATILLQRARDRRTHWSTVERKVRRQLPSARRSAFGPKLRERHNTALT